MSNRRLSAIANAKRHLTVVGKNPSNQHVGQTNETSVSRSNEIPMQCIGRKGSNQNTDRSIEPHNSDKNESHKSRNKITIESVKHDSLTSLKYDIAKDQFDTLDDT